VSRDAAILTIRRSAPSRCTKRSTRPSWPRPYGNILEQKSGTASRLSGGREAGDAGLPPAQFTVFAKVESVSLLGIKLRFSARKLSVGVVLPGATVKAIKIPASRAAC